MSDRFVLYDETFRNPVAVQLDPMTGMPTAPAAPVVIATAADEATARTVGATHSAHPDYTWVQYDLEADGTTLCNGRVRDDLPPHTP